MNNNLCNLPKTAKLYFSGNDVIVVVVSDRAYKYFIW